MTSRERPMSPYLQYRWQYTNTLSFLHRITGIFMSLGLALFVYWLVALASGPAGYDRALESLATWPARLALAAWSFAFFYHLLNGIRHLVWDTGRGLERVSARRSGWAVVVASMAATAIAWLAIATRFGGGAT